MYASLGTRPKISFAVTTLSHFNSKPLGMHMTAAKRISQYLKHTRKLKLSFEAQGKSTNLISFMDSDWAGCTSTQKSMSTCIFGHGNINENLGPIIWQAKGQSIIALSS
jgi:hypothetical protein